MGFSVGSKFIGNPRLLQSDVIPSRAMDPTSFVDNFVYDTCTAAPIIALWTPTTAITGSVSHSATGWYADLDTTTALNDSAKIESIVHPLQGSDDGYFGLRFQLACDTANVPAPADNEAIFGWVKSDFSEMIAIENTGIDTFRLTTTWSGGGTSNGTPFALDLVSAPATVELRAYLVGGNMSKAEVYVNDVLMDMIDTVANIPNPAGNGCVAHFCLTKLDALAVGDCIIYVQFCQFFWVDGV